jgi:hypothetical protein
MSNYLRSTSLHPHCLGDEVSSGKWNKNANEGQYIQSLLKIMEFAINDNSSSGQNVPVLITLNNPKCIFVRFKCIYMYICFFLACYLLLLLTNSNLFPVWELSKRIEFAHGTPLIWSFLSCTLKILNYVTIVIASFVIYGVSVQYQV